MVSLLLTAILFLQADEPGRTDDPSGLGGALIVIGIALAAAVTVAAAIFLVLRLFRTRRERDRSARATDAPLPSEQGRPWSSER